MQSDYETESCLDLAEDLESDLQDKSYPEYILKMANALADAIHEYEEDPEEEGEKEEDSDPFESKDSEGRKKDLEGMKDKMKKSGILITIGTKKEGT